MSERNHADIERQSTLSRAISRLPAINRWRRIWGRKHRDDAQLGGQDKRDSLRLCPAVELSFLFNAFIQAP